MRLKYQSRNGHVLAADTAKEIIDQLQARNRFEAETTYRQYVEGVAEREKIYTGHVLDTSSPEAFLESAVASGLLVPLQ